MIEVKMVCEDCEYDFWGEEQFIEDLDDNMCNDHICNDDWSHKKGYTKNIIFKSEIKQYIKKQWGHDERSF